MSSAKKVGQGQGPGMGPGPVTSKICGSGVPRNPGVEAAREERALVSAPHHFECARQVRLRKTTVLHVELRRAQRQLQLHVGRAPADPREHVRARVEQHHVVVQQVLLAEIRALLRYREVT